MVLLEKPITVVLLTCMGVRAWGYPSYFIVVRIGKAFLALRKVAPIFTSADVDVTFLISWHRLWMDPLLVGRVRGLSPFSTIWLTRGKWSSAWLRVHCSKSYDVSLPTWRIMLLEWYCIVESGEFLHSLITKQCPPCWLCWRGTVLWKWCSGTPTWSVIQIWHSIGKFHRLSECTVYNERPLILPFQCQYTWSFRRTWSGSSSVGHLVFFCFFALELEEGCFDVYQHEDAHIPVDVVPFEC